MFHHTTDYIDLVIYDQWHTWKPIDAHAAMWYCVHFAILAHLVATQQRRGWFTYVYINYIACAYCITNKAVCVCVHSKHVNQNDNNSLAFINFYSSNFPPTNFCAIWYSNTNYVTDLRNPPYTYATIICNANLISVRISRGRDASTQFIIIFLYSTVMSWASVALTTLQS